MSAKVGKSGAERRREAALSRIKQNISKAKPMEKSNLRGCVDSANSLKQARDRAHEAVEKQLSRTENYKISDVTRRMIDRGVEFAFYNKNRIGRDG
jgi:hypothetical protein